MLALLLMLLSKMKPNSTHPGALMSEQFVFSDLRELFAKANEEKSGDQLAGIAAGSERERVAAKRQLADLSLDEIIQQPLIDPDKDEVSRLILDTFDRDAFQPIKSMTVGEFRERILDDATFEIDLRRIQRAIVPEIAAALAKIMSNKDLILAAAGNAEEGGRLRPRQIHLFDNRVELADDARAGFKLLGLPFDSGH